MVSARIRSLVDDDSEEPRREKRVRRSEIERQTVSLITPKPTLFDVLRSPPVYSRRVSSSYYSPCGCH